MMKRLYILLSLLVLAVVGASAGTWKTHNAFVSTQIDNIFDTGDKVYYLNCNNLFQFDKATQATIALGRQNILSDNMISQIYYDYEYNLLFVAYANSNIDVIDGYGKVTNISAIKNMVLPPTTYTLGEKTHVLEDCVSKAINDITFAGGVAYVSVGYGFITIDETTLRVKKNYHMGKNITVYSAGMVGNRLYVISGRYCYYGDPTVSDPRNELTRVSGSFATARTYPINDHSIFVMIPGATGALYNYDFSSGTPTLTRLISAGPFNVQKTSTGFIANFIDKSYYYTINSAGTTATKTNNVTSTASSNPNGDGTVWVLDANGLHTSGSGAYYKINTLTTASPFWLKYNAAMDKLYVGMSGPNNSISTTDMNAVNAINTYDGAHWADVTAYTAKGGGYQFVFSPTDPTTYVRGSWSNGLHKVANDVLKTNYTSSNSPISSIKPSPAFDNYGNLWVVCSYGAASNPVVVLPKDKFDKTSVSKSDWFIPSGLLKLNTGSMQRSRFMVSKKSNVKIYSDCDFPSGAYIGRFICWDNGSENVKDDNYRLVSITHFVDQFNKQVEWVHLMHFEEDNEGLIWVAHDMGLFVLDPDVIFDDYPRVVRPYVTTSSEGKAGEGYLCEGFTVYDVGVDRDNNKWLATNNGLYFVSPDGSEVYNHFATENSDIPSNKVFSVECDTVNNRVYIATDNGFAEYVATGEAAALNFDNVYAYPNPVEPDFTGLIKISNLMENTYVTITDRKGNVVAQMGPVMGSALWDGNGADGDRLPTGLYDVYAAQGSQPAVNGDPVVSVLIIK